MAFRPSPVIPDLDVTLFRQLQAFEVGARAAGAPREIVGTMAAARSSVRLAYPRSWIPVPPGH
jgi:hypothetical protein